MSYVQTGSCPKCGAPIYAPSVWMSVTPPPATHTCLCHSSIPGNISTVTNIKIWDKLPTIEDYPKDPDTEKIERLEKQLAIALEALELYATDPPWHMVEHRSYIGPDDEPVDENNPDYWWVRNVKTRNVSHGKGPAMKAIQSIKDLDKKQDL